MYLAYTVLSSFIARLVYVDEALVFDSANSPYQSLSIVNAAIVVLEFDFADVAIKVLLADTVMRPADLAL